MKKRYWMCIIGPVDQDATPDGSDAPMRNAVEDAFAGVAGHNSDNCWSGWGLTEKRMEEVMETWNSAGEEQEKRNAADNL